jgi:Predicted membrane protein (DUF2207) C-terminal domain/Predicted membrane protein (DUF2207) N-terminal domain
MRGRLSPLVVVMVAALAAATTGPALSADEGWVIDRLNIRLDVHPDGSVAASEAVDVDFRGLQRHGLYRDLLYRFRYDAAHDRIYAIRLGGVTDADGRKQPVATTTDGPRYRFRIGDPNRTITGNQTYRLRYTIAGALNGFPDHDELYWNATGTWPVSVTAASVLVTAPPGAIDRVDCFEGREGSTERCTATLSAGGATFTAKRPLTDGEQMTIVAGLRKGAVAPPSPILIARPRTFPQFFDRTPWLVGLALAGFAAAIGGIGGLWWRLGRDRRYVSVHYLSNDPREERVPLFGSDQIAVEFQPPDNMRPAQMGLLLDERADRLDVTATIVDLAVRGYLKINEHQLTGISALFGKPSYGLERLKEPDVDLLEYEHVLMSGLFRSQTTVDLSKLKGTFFEDLQKAKTALYRDGVRRGWFPRNPNTVRNLWRAVGIFVAGAGSALTFLLGSRWGAGLAGLPVVAGGLMLAAVAGAMPRRTAAGRDAMRRPAHRRGQGRP